MNEGRLLRWVETKKESKAGQKKEDVKAPRA